MSTNRDNSKQRSGRVPTIDSAEEEDRGARLLRHRAKRAIGTVEILRNCEPNDDD